MKYYNQDVPRDTADHIVSLLPPSPIDNRRMGIIPPSPIPPSAIGGGSNMYATLNPWNMRRYQENQISERTKIEQTQVEINRWICRNAISVLGLNESDYDLEQMYPSYTPPFSNYDEMIQHQKETREYEKIVVASQSNQVYSNELVSMQNKLIEQEQKNLEKYAGKSKTEQYAMLQEAYVEQMEWERTRQQRDFSKKYSKSDFRRYLSSPKSYATMDDLEVQLPDGITGDYSRKRAKFLQRIANVRI